MTSIVIIKAHCGKDKEVQVSITDPTMNQSLIEQFTVQDGDVAERVVFDSRVVSVCEVRKA